VWQREAVRQFRQGEKFIRHVVPAIAKPVHSLWNQVIGFFFACLAVMFGARALAYVRSYTLARPADQTGELVRVIMTGTVALIMAIFAVVSFLKARQISRS
jgi:uncharacterized membrane protein